MQDAVWQPWADPIERPQPNPRPWVYNLCLVSLICISAVGMLKDIL
jgi:hypothetical protein